MRSVVLEDHVRNINDGVLFRRTLLTHRSLGGDDGKQEDSGVAPQQDSKGADGDKPHEASTRKRKRKRVSVPSSDSACEETRER